MTLNAKNVFGKKLASSITKQNLNKDIEILT